jgi:uncharacterized repeat protein (TIGR03803 family)
MLALGRRVLVGWSDFISEVLSMLKVIDFRLSLLAPVLASLFAITAPAQTLTTLYSFTGGATDGGNPDAGLVRDAKGDLYGTTVNAGSYNNGTVFEVSASGKETVLHNFAGSPDGAEPYGGFLVRDGKANLYGATFWGGAYGGGTVFELPKKGPETILYCFGSAQGFADGTTVYGGVNGSGCWSAQTSSGCGTVFKLSQ